MEAIHEKKNIHHGMNTRLARTWKKVTQDDLASRMGMNQSEVSLLESEIVIKNETLEKIAQALDIPVDFLKEFEPEAAIKHYTLNNNENKENVSIYQGDGEQNNTYYPLDTVKELYERLLQEKEKEIASLKEKLK